MAGRKTMRHSEEWWELVAGPADVRCEAHTQDGNRCRRAALHGANVCTQHGVNPETRQKAAARIGNAAYEMVKRLHAMLDDPSVDSRDKIKIMQDMLDRGGYNAANKHIVGVVEADPVEALFRTLLADPANFVDSAPTQVQALPSVPDDGTSSPLLGDWRENYDDVVDADWTEEEEDLIGSDEPVNESAPMPKRVVEDLGPQLRRQSGYH